MKPPRTLEQATELLARYAELDGKRAEIEELRNGAIGRINASADEEAAPVLAKLEQLTAALSPWWAKAAAGLLPKGRKSVQLGGCMIGSKKSRASLAIAGEEADVVATLQGLRWAKPLLRFKYSLNKPVIMSYLDGPRRVALAELGITKDEGEDQFFIERVEQPGTVSQ